MQPSLYAGWPALCRSGLLLLLFGCAFKESGLARPSADGVVLDMMDGRQVPLKTDTDSDPLRFLDGHSVHVEGRRVGRAVRVSEWQVLEGLHGMNVWVGPVGRNSGGIGVDDRNSRVFYWVDEEAAATLAPWLGKVVLIEGYVDGHHRVHATAWRPLSEPPARP